MPGLLGLCDMCFCLERPMMIRPALFKNSCRGLVGLVTGWNMPFPTVKWTLMLEPINWWKCCCFFPAIVYCIHPLSMYADQPFLGTYLQDQSTILDDKTPGIVRQEEIVELLLQPRPEIVACRAWFGWESENFEASSSSWMIQISM